jgi:hypothetical protein
MPELQRPGEEVVHDANKSHDRQNGLMPMAGSLSSLVGIAQDYNPQSVEGKKLGLMPLKAGLAAAPALEVRACCALPEQTQWLGEVQ